MSEQSLKLNLIMGMVDKITAPSREITSSTQRMAGKVRESQEALTRLGDASRDIDQFRLLKQGLAQTEQSMIAAKQKAKELAQQMAATANPSRKLTAEFNRARQEARKLSQQHQQEQQQLQGLRNSLNQAGVSTRNLNQSSRELQRNAERQNRTLAEQSRALVLMTERQQKLNAAREQATQISTVIGSAAGGMIAGVGVASVASPALMAQQAAAKMAASQGLDVTAAQQYRDMITDIYASSSTPIEQTIEAIDAISAALGGVGKASKEEIAALASHTVALGKAYNLSAAEAAQTATQLVTNGLAKNAEQAFDLLTSGLSKLSVSMRGELPEIINEYGVHFKNLGMSGSQSMGLLVEASKSGKWALDKTGDALKEFTLRGTDMSKASQEAYKKIDLSASEMASAIVEGGAAARDALTQTAQGLLDLDDPVERANAAIALFGTPIEDLSIDKIPEFLKALTTAERSMEGVDGATQKLTSAMGNNAVDGFNRLRQAVTGSLMKTFNQLEPQIMAVTSAITAFVNENPKLVTMIGAVVAVIAGLAIAGATISLVTTAVAGMSAAFGAAKLVASLLTKEQLKLSVSSAMNTARMVAATAVTWAMLGAQKAQAAGTAALTAAQWAWNVALNANPIGLVIMAVAAFIGLAALVYKNWEPIKVFFAGLWNSFIGGFDGVKQVFAWLQAAFSTVVEFASAALSGIWNALLSGFEPVRKIFSWLGEKISSFIDSLSVVNSVKDAIGGVWDSLFGDDEENRSSSATASTNALLPSVEVAVGGQIVPPAPAAPSINTSYAISVHATPGMDEKALAVEVRRQLDARDAAAAQRNRGRLID